MNTTAVSINAILTVALVLGAALLAFALQRHALFIGGSLLCAFYAAFALRHATFKPDQLLPFLALLALLLPAFFKPYFGLTSEFYVFNTVATFLAAHAVTRHPPPVLLWAFRIIYWCSIGLIAVALYTFWGVPEPLGEVIPGSSTNGIPSYLIVVQIGLSLCNYLVHRQLPLLSAIATCIVAFFGYGRGSLIVALMILGLSLVFNIALWRSTSRWRQTVLLLLGASTAYGLALYVGDLVALLSAYTKLGAGLADVNRLGIWEQYIAKLDAWTMLVGADYSGTVIETEYHRNPHIAYIRTHALFGLPATLLALASPAFVFFSHKSLSAKFVFATFIGMAALRAVSEPILFPTLLDLMYFSFLFMFFRYAPRHPHNNHPDVAQSVPGLTAYRTPPRHRHKPMRNVPSHH